MAYQTSEADSLEMLRTLFDANGEFNAAHWVLLSAWSTWILILVGLLIAALCWLNWRNGRGLSTKRRVTLLTLRIATVILVFLFDGALFFALSLGVW